MPKCPDCGEDHPEVDDLLDEIKEHLFSDAVVKDIEKHAVNEAWSSFNRIISILPFKKQMMAKIRFACVISMAIGDEVCAASIRKDEDEISIFGKDLFDSLTQVTKMRKDAKAKKGEVIYDGNLCKAQV